MLIRRVPFETLADLSLAALKQARSLLNDARVMSDVERVPTAFILAGLAADEFGKHVLLMAFPGRDTSDDQEWKKLWRRFWLHVEKLGNAVLQMWWDDLTDPNDPPVARDLHLARLRATYVDLDDDREEVLEPHQAITRDELDHLLLHLDRSIAHAERTFGDKTTSQIAEAMRATGEAHRSIMLHGDAQSSVDDLLVRAATLQVRRFAAESGLDPNRAEELWQAVMDQVAVEHSE